jgi:hypothetical protein
MKLKEQTTIRENAQGDRPEERSGSLSLGTEVRQAFLIEPNGVLLVPWVAPSAGPLVRAVWAALTIDDFPITGTTENIYCG